MDHNLEQVLKDLEEIGIGANEYHVKDDLPDITSHVIIIPNYRLGYRPYARASGTAIALNLGSNQLLNKCWLPVNKLDTINYKGVKYLPINGSAYHEEQIIFNGATYYPYSIVMSSYIVGDSDVLKELLCILREYHLHAAYKNVG